MSTHPPNPAADDDTLADALADAWIERAASDPVIRRAALRAAGLLQETTTLPEIAQQCGLSESAARRVVSMFRARLAAAILQDPNSPPHIRQSAARTFAQP